jgi:hypothetical protein
MGFLLMKWCKTWQFIRIPYGLSPYTVKAHPMVGGSHDTPLLAFETVHTAKGKLIPQPRPIPLVLRVACWAMPAQGRSARIDEGDHRRAVGCALAWRSNC